MKKILIMLTITLFLLVACGGSVSQTSITGSAVLDTETVAEVKEEPKAEPSTDPSDKCGFYENQKKELGKLTDSLNDYKRDMILSLNSLESASGEQADTLNAKIDKLVKDMNAIKPQITLLQKQVDALAKGC